MLSFANVSAPVYLKALNAAQRCSLLFVQDSFRKTRKFWGDQDSSDQCKQRDTLSMLHQLLKPSCSSSAQAFWSAGVLTGGNSCNFKTVPKLFPSAVTLVGTA